MTELSTPGAASAHMGPMTTTTLPPRRPYTPRYLERTRELDAYCARHGKLPSAFSPEPSERSLYSWIAVQRSKGNVSEHLARLLKDFAADRAPNDPQARLLEFEAFCIEHQRLPSQFGKTKAEARLYYWMNSHRQKASPMPRLYELYEQYRSSRGRPPTARSPRRAP